MTRQWLVYIAGSTWTATRGTDHRLVEALARHVQVLWVDPPRPILGRAAGWRLQLGRLYRVDEVAPRVTRLRITAPPGAVRFPSRVVAGHAQRRLLKTFVDERGIEPIGVVVASPLATFPDGVHGHRVLYVTDDWIAGARLMGISGRAVQRQMHTNLRVADTVMSVSPVLSERLARLGSRSADTLPNGCTISKVTEPNPPTRRPVATVVGQLNERLDLGILEAVRAAGIPLEIVGPQRAREPAAVGGWETFLGRPGVVWLGEVSERDVSRHLASVAVGLTPYTKTAFNESSFPLKTLEYLASGIPVVSTDLPASRWLNCDDVLVGHSREEFVHHVGSLLASGAGHGSEYGRVAFARRHTWEARADTLLGVIGGYG